MTKKNKICLILGALVLALLSALQIELSLFAQNKTTYEIELDEDNVIESIYINDFVQDLTLIYDDVTEDNTIVADEKINIKFECSVIDNVTINFKNKNNIKIKKDGKTQKIKKTFYFTKSSIYKNIIDSLNGYFLLFTIIDFIIYYICLKYIYKFFLKLKDNNIKIRDIILFTFLVFLIYFGCLYIVLSTLKTLTLVPIILILIYIFYKTKNYIFKKIEYIYLIIAIIVGIALIFLLPPLNVPDEPEHFTKSYSLTSSRYNNDEGQMHYPKVVYNFVEQYHFNALNIKEKFNGKDSFSQLSTKINYNEKGKKFYRYGNVKHSLSITYLPSAIIMYPFVKLGCSQLIIYLFGKFINFLITILLGYYAIKKIPKFKKILFLIMLTPIYLQQSAAFNVDYITNALSIYIISTIVYYIYEAKKISNNDVVKLFILGVLLSLCKFGYFPIMFSVLLIPKKKFEKKKISSLVIKLMIILVTIGLSFLLNRSLGGATDTTSTGRYTIGYSLTHIFNTIKVFVNTLLARGDLDFFRGFFTGYGVSTMWLCSLFQTILIIIYGILFLESNDKDYNISKKERILYFIIGSMLLAIPYAAMYLCWTRLGSDTIDGVQPRYFIIGSTMVFISLSNNILKLNIKDKNKFYCICMIIIYVLVFETIINGYY